MLRRFLGLRIQIRTRPVPIRAAVGFDHLGAVSGRLGWPGGMTWEVGWARGRRRMPGGGRSHSNGKLASMPPPTPRPTADTTIQSCNCAIEPVSVSRTTGEMKSVPDQPGTDGSDGTGTAASSDWFSGKPTWVVAMSASPGEATARTARQAQ